MRRHEHDAALDRAVRFQTGRPATQTRRNGLLAARPLASLAELEEILRTAIRDLRPAVREAVEIQHLQEASMKEAASRMGVSIGATKGRLFHGRAKLREALRLRMRKHGRAEDYLQHSGHGLRQSAHGLPS